MARNDLRIHVGPARRQGAGEIPRLASLRLVYARGNSAILAETHPAPAEQQRPRAVSLTVGRPAATHLSKPGMAILAGRFCAHRIENRPRWNKCCKESGYE